MSNKIKKGTLKEVIRKIVREDFIDRNFGKGGEERVADFLPQTKEVEPKKKKNENRNSGCGCN
jgi:hypothetical protein